MPFIEEEEEEQQYHRNAPVHTYNVVQDIVQEQSVSILPWPVVSPDMNPIENVWAVLGKKVRKAKPQPKSSNELFHCHNNPWNTIDANFIEKLTSGMRRRLNAIKQSNGWHTKY